MFLHSSIKEAAMANDFFPEMKLREGVAKPASSQLQEAIENNQRVYVLSTCRQGERCVERDHLGATLRRVLASEAFVEKLGGIPLSPRELSTIWRIAHCLWPLMKEGRSCDPQVRHLLNEVWHSENSLYIGLNKVYGTSEMRYVRDYVRKRMFRHFKDTRREVSVEVATERYLKPLTFIACVLVRSGEDIGF